MPGFTQLYKTWTFGSGQRSTALPFYWRRLPSKGFCMKLSAFVQLVRLCRQQAKTGSSEPGLFTWQISVMTKESVLHKTWATSRSATIINRNCCRARRDFDSYFIN